VVSLIEILVHFSASTYKRSGGHPVTSRLPDRACHLKETGLREESQSREKGGTRKLNLLSGGTENVRVTVAREMPL
jgi:hypothetical protein